MLCRKSRKYPNFYSGLRKAMRRTAGDQLPAPERLPAPARCTLRIAVHGVSGLPYGRSAANCYLQASISYGQGAVATARTRGARWDDDLLDLELDRLDDAGGVLHLVVQNERLAPPTPDDRRAAPVTGRRHALAAANEKLATHGTYEYPLAELFDELRRDGLVGGVPRRLTTLKLAPRGTLDLSVAWLQRDVDESRFLVHSTRWELGKVRRELEQEREARRADWLTSALFAIGLTSLTNAALTSAILDPPKLAALLLRLLSLLSQWLRSSGLVDHDVFAEEWRDVFDLRDMATASSAAATSTASPPTPSPPTPSPAVTMLAIPLLGASSGSSPSGTSTLGALSASSSSDAPSFIALGSMASSQSDPHQVPPPAALAAHSPPQPSTVGAHAFGEAAALGCSGYGELSYEALATSLPLAALLFALLLLLSIGCVSSLTLWRHLGQVVATTASALGACASSVFACCASCAASVCGKFGVKLFDVCKGVGACFAAVGMGVVAIFLGLFHAVHSVASWFCKGGCACLTGIFDCLSGCCGGCCRRVSNCFRRITSCLTRMCSLCMAECCDANGDSPRASPRSDHWRQMPRDQRGGGYDDDGDVYDDERADESSRPGQAAYGGSAQLAHPVAYSNRRR